MDTDDATMNNQEMRDYFKNLKDSYDVDIVYHYGDSKSKIEACNANLENENGDAVILVSDDMVPAQTGMTSSLRLWNIMDTTLEKVLG